MMWQILVRDITAKKMYTLMVEPSDTIQSIKHQIQDNEGIDPDCMYLLCGGKALVESDRSLLDYNIEKDSILDLRRRASPRSAD